MKGKNLFCMLMSSAAMVTVATPAIAQEERAAADSASSSEGFKDIIVTANRREQKLQDVPLAISAVTAEAAEARGVTGTSSLQMVVPSLVVTRVANVAQPYIRGLGSSAGNVNSEPSVAMYVDGVYYPSANANFFDFNNIERVEVLKGPQGTLFGRNATGGVIQLITKDPGSVPEMDFKVGYANYNTVTANAYLAGPITDTLGANLAVLYKDQGDGWGKNIFTGKDTVTEHNFGVRGKLVWSPDEATQVHFSADYARNRNGAINAQNPRGTTNFNPDTIMQDILDGGPGRGDPYPGDYNTNNDYEQRSVVETGGVALRVNHDFGGFNLMSLSAYRKTQGYWRYDQDLSPSPFTAAEINQKARMYSQEVHLSSPGTSKFQWLVGAYYFDYKPGTNPQSLTGDLLEALFDIPGISFYDVTHTKSFSVFAQGTYPIFENTNLTVGGRYTWEKVSYDGVTYVYGTDFVIPGIGGPVSNSRKKNAPTFRVTIDHKITPNVMLYASFNRGVKSGNFETGAFDQTLGEDSYFKPERVNAYEVGVKSELFDRKLTLNVGGFYYDFTNMQFQRIVAGSGLTFNAPNGAKLYGVEAEYEARVSSRLTINGSVSYLHTELRDFPNAPNTCSSSVTGLNDNGGYFCNGPDGLPDPSNLIPYNAKGNRTPNSPEWTINTGATYTIPSSVGAFTLAGNVSYITKTYFEIDNRTNNPAMLLANASLRWTDLSEHMSVTVWGRNLTDKYYYTENTGQGGGADAASPAPPREYGVTLGYKF